MAKWDYYDDLRAKTLIKYLKSLPKDEWVKSYILEEVCNIKDDPKHHERKIRNLINETMKRYSIPIASGGKGYKIATCQKDVDTTKKSTYATIRSLKQRMEILQLNFDNHINKKTKKPKRIKLMVKPEQLKLFDKTIDYSIF